MIGFYTNITKIKNLEMELSKLQKAIEHSPISIVITDIKGNIEYVNPNFCQITGYSAEEAMGNNPRVLKSAFEMDCFKINSCNKSNSWLRLPFKSS